MARAILPDMLDSLATPKPISPPWQAAAVRGGVLGLLDSFKTWRC